MKKNYVIPVVVVIVLLGGWLVFGGRKTQAPGNTDTTKKTTSSSSASPSSSSDSDASQAVPTNSLSIENMAFSPAAVTIPAGATVHWNNNDSMAHTVTADDGSFDSGEIAKGSSFTHQFDKPGTYKYHCSIHSSMIGTVIVRQP